MWGWPFPLTHQYFAECPNAGQRWVLLPSLSYLPQLISAAKQPPGFTTHLFAISHKYFECYFILILVLRGG